MFRFSRPPNALPLSRERRSKNIASELDADAPLVGCSGCWAASPGYQLSSVRERPFIDPRKPHSMIIAIAISENAAVMRLAAMIRS